MINEDYIMKKITTLLALVSFAGMVSAQTLDRSVRPAPAPAKEIKIEDAKTFTLNNGLKVFVVEDKRAPIIFYSIQLDIKPELEGDKCGMSEIFSAVIGSATKTRNKEQLNREIDLIGAKISSGRRGSYGTSLKKYEHQMLELMTDILLNPVFNSDEMNLQLDKERSGLKMLADDAGSMVQRLSPALRYGNKFPKGEVFTEETLNNITVQDLENFHKTYFAPNVARLVIVGDISEAEAKANAEKYFGKWAKKNVPVAAYTQPVAPVKTKVAMIEKPGAIQSAIDVTYPITFKPGAPDKTAADVMAYIFGEGSTCRLFQNLREQHSYTYGVYASLTSDELMGDFSLTSGRGAALVKAASTDSAIYQIDAEMRRIISTPVSGEELKMAKAYLAGNFARSLAEPATIALFALNIDKYKLPKDYYKNYLKRLDAVTVADVQAAAKKYIKPDNAWIIVAGDKSCAEGLKQFAGSHTVQFYDVNANPIEAPVAKTADITAEAVINKYINALGGKTAIEKINDYKITSEMSMMGQKMDVLQAFKKPNYSLSLISVGGMTVQKIAFNGTRLKMSGMEGNQELTEGEEWESTKAEAGVCPEMNYVKNGYQLTVKGIEKVNGKDAYALEITKGKFTSTGYFDVASGLKLKSVINVDTPQGPMQQISEYDGYSSVEGIQFPHIIKQSAGGMTMDMSVKSIEVNKGVDNSLFE